MCFSKIWEQLTQPAPPTPEPTIYTPVSNRPIELQEIYNILLAQFPGIDFDVIKLSDSVSILCNMDDVAYFLAEHEANKFPYVAEYYDCDDYALKMAGDFSIPQWANLCIGEIWTDTHAFNILINEDKEILFVEPQTNEISTELFGSGTKITLVKV